MCLIFISCSYFWFNLTKIILKKDIRKFRLVQPMLRTGKYLAVLTLLFDSQRDICCFYNFRIFRIISLFAFFCLCHIFSIWQRWQGCCHISGIMFAIFDYFIVFILSWLILIVIFKYSSLSSICSVLSVTIYDFFFMEKNIILFLITSFIITIYTHKNNLHQLINKKEPKIFK